MSAQRIAVGKEILWRGESYEIKRLLPGNQLNLENMITGALTIANISDLVTDLYDGLLIFVQEGKHVRPRQDQSVAEVKYLDLSDCPQHRLEIARFRLWCIQPVLDLKPRARHMVIARVQEVNALLASGKQSASIQNVSVTSVYQWIADYEHSGRDLRALIPHFDERGGKGKGRMPPEVEAIINAVIEDKYSKREKSSVEDVLHEVAARIDDENSLRTKTDHLRCPVRDTIERRIDALDIKTVFVSRHGKRAAEHEFSQFSVGPKVKVPLERVEIDHTRLDLIVIDDKETLS